MKSIALYVAATLVAIPILLAAVPFMLLGLIIDFDDKFEPHMESHQP